MKSKAKTGELASFLYIALHNISSSSGSLNAVYFCGTSQQQSI
ncbi:MAG TPA: hypothetical protein VE076_07015 [Nitrososphaeraceae archaeon]|nr:hypothetical protein [Nitrososphaeraceae archaeon]